MRTSGRSVTRKLFIASDEAALIKYQLDLVARPEVVKAGLQRLCGHLESGLHLADSGPFRTTIVGLVFTGALMVRRWAYKALAYIGHKDDIKTLSERMRTESDPENLTWIMSAIFSLSRAATVVDVCRETGTEYSDGMALAALLYGKNALERIGVELPQVNIETADALTLKWCALLAGYQKAPANLMHPRFENRALLGVLNAHDAYEVSEYSVWALWKSPEFSISDLTIPQHEFLSRPENVRRWTNRLIAKSPQFLADNLDLFDDLYDDEEAKAREGLALGLRDVHFPELQPHVLRWYEREANVDLRELILEHMATSDDANTALFDLLYGQYSTAQLDGSLRRRLRAAVSSRGGRLFQAFQVIDVANSRIADSASFFTDDPSRKGLLTVNNNTTFNVGRDLLAQNVAGGDIIAVDNESMQVLNQTQTDVADVLRQIVELTKTPNVFTKEQSNQIVSAVNAVSQEPTVENKGKLLETLKSVASVVTIGSAATKLPEIISVVSSWL